MTNSILLNQTITIKILFYAIIDLMDIIYPPKERRAEPSLKNGAYFYGAFRLPIKNTYL